MQGPRAAVVEPYRPYGCKDPSWKRFLKAGEELSRGQMLLSADHKSKALMQDDGNFVIYSHDPEGKEIVTFATGTDADPNATSSSDFKLGSRLAMQPDHDLVLLSDSGEIIWRTNTVGKGMGGGETVYAALDDAGVLHVIDAAGGSVWNSGGSVLSQLRASALDAAAVAMQVGSVAREKAVAAAGTALEAGKGLAGAAYDAGKAALARATGGSGSGSGGGGGGVNA